MASPRAPPAIGSSVNTAPSGARFEAVPRNRQDEQGPPLTSAQPSSMQDAAFTLLTGPVVHLVQQEPVAAPDAFARRGIPDPLFRVTATRATAVGGRNWCATLPRRH